ncbi:MAG: hypothetical protein LBH08_02280 [Puniceicoccales bacterium]|jgi:hypothetical protein|nr:hypothetical protein [Puniceicoccales bacterium]
MQQSRKDKKLSQLFKLKSIEIPTEEFWGNFEMGLQRKLLGQMNLSKAKRISFGGWLHILFQKYKMYFTSFSYATCGVVLLLACYVYPWKTTAQLKDSILAFSGEVLPLQRIGKDATLILRMPEVQYSNYVRDDIYTSGLNSREKELAF